MTNPSIPAKTREVFEYLKNCASQIRTVTYKEIAEEINLAKSGIDRPLGYINQNTIDRLNYGAEIVWVEVNKYEDSFLGFMDEVMGVLESPEAPEYSPKCQWCSYIGKAVYVK